MRITSARWASQHDWFRGTTIDETGEIIIIAAEIDYYPAQKRLTERLVQFSSARDLALWAGY